MGEHVLRGAVRDHVRTGALRGDPWMATRLIEELSRAEAAASDLRPSLTTMRAELEGIVADIEAR